jgi:hypothetical protein
MINIEADQKQRRINAILTAFPEKVSEVYKKAIKAGLTAADKTQTQSITQTYAISRANLNDKNTTRRKIKSVADRGVITGEMRYNGYKLPLYRFSVTPKLPSRDTSRRIHTMINGEWVTVGASRSVHARQLIGGNNEAWKTGFIAQMKSGHIGVFYRDNPYDIESPIKEAMGSSVAEMAGNTVVLEKTEAASYTAVVEGADKLIQRILAGG